MFTFIYGTILGKQASGQIKPKSLFLCQKVTFPIIVFALICKCKTLYLYIILMLLPKISYC